MIKQIVTYLGICDGNMEEGSLRCDANISVRLRGAEKLGTRTEVKNVNSFRNAERAIEYEIARQIELVEDGGTVVQETLLWDADKNVAISMRSKEEAHDYRYFPEPDLVPVVISDEWIEQVRRDLPELPEKRRDRFIADYGLPKYDADILTLERPLADYYENAVNHLSAKTPDTFKAVSNWMMTDVLRVVKDTGGTIGEFPVTPANLAAMVNLISEGTISGKIAKEVFEDMLATGETPKAIVERKGLVQISDTGAIETIIDEILAANAGQVEQYRAGKSQVYGFFVGAAMKAMKGKANPKVVNDLLKKKLDN
jgi:aspartyl-tRNA(Asn)/glutamyl-tRNA(Gln) amidotransferase subunit B